jgi:hypothetical protein
VGGIELAVHQLVAHRCPGRFLGRDDLDAVLLVELLTAAMTTEQSVSGMKPMRTSFFSGASEPAAHAPRLNARRAFRYHFLGTMGVAPAPQMSTDGRPCPLSFISSRPAAFDRAL